MFFIDTIYIYSTAPLGLKFNTLVDSGNLGQRSLQKQLRDLQGRNNLHHRVVIGLPSELNDEDSYVTNELLQCP